METFFPQFDATSNFSIMSRLQEDYQPPSSYAREEKGSLLSHISHIFLSPSSPPADSPNTHSPGSSPLKIAIIGAGITGLTSAAHCIRHGFSNIVIFESGPIHGGIWTTTTPSSPSSSTPLKLNLAIYRPSILPSSVDDALCNKYNLPSKTIFNTKVEDIYQDNLGKWIINSPRYGRFDGVICCIGTVGEPRLPRMPGMDRFLRAGGEVWHSSRLAGGGGRGIARASTPTTPTPPPTITEPKVIATMKKCEVRDKRVLIIDNAENEGSGVVEALEFVASEGAKSATVLLAGKRKRLLPKGLVGDLAVLVFGEWLVNRVIPAVVLQRLFCRDVEDLVAMLDPDTVERLRSLKTEWITCTINHFSSTGVTITRLREGGKRLIIQKDIDADVVVMATGYKQPQLSAFLPGTCFPPTYKPPNWFLGTFPTNHPSIACINHRNSGGRFGNWRTGLCTRVLFMFLLEPRTVASPFWMRRGVDITRVIRATSLIGNLEIFCYVELIGWFVLCVAVNPFRWKWVIFILFGVELMLPGGGRMDEFREGGGFKVQARMKMAQPPPSKKSRMIV
ncbi:hypothetical protein QBC43DRAFT_306287 [Cladorrhinum sp. PSN259]|nr:hypothetical protein QBC43DRAFT_306287 [Cladorrhinum sp. PSN259]